MSGDPGGAAGRGGALRGFGEAGGGGGGSGWCSPGSCSSPTSGSACSPAASAASASASLSLSFSAMSADDSPRPRLEIPWGVRLRITEDPHPLLPRSTGEYRGREQREQTRYLRIIFTVLPDAAAFIPAATAFRVVWP